MKNCPNCDKKPISLWVWGVQLNPFRISCKHCAQALVAERSIYIGIAVLTLSMPLLVWVGVTQLDIDFTTDRHLIIALLLVPAFIGGPVVYGLGGYKLAGAKES